MGTGRRDSARARPCKKPSGIESNCRIRASTTALSSALQPLAVLSATLNSKLRDLLLDSNGTLGWRTSGRADSKAPRLTFEPKKELVCGSAVRGAFPGLTLVHDTLRRCCSEKTVEARLRRCPKATDVSSRLPGVKIVRSLEVGSV